MKARHVCAVLGVAIAVGTVVFMQGLVKTNDYQATAVAERLLKEVPVANEAKVAQFAIDYRPNGHVMQGPPMMACVAGMKWDDAGWGMRKGECVVTKAMFAQRRLPVPPVGTELTLIGRKKTHYLKIVGFLDWEKPLRGYPNCFVGAGTAAAIDENWSPWKPKTVVELAPSFMNEAGRNMDRAKPLLLWAAALTALCLLVNSLFLTIEAKRREIAILRMVGMTRGGVVFRVFLRALQLTVLGDTLGLVVASVALWVYVKLDPVTFPAGPGPLNPLAWGLDDRLFVASIAVAIVAALIALRPALKVKPLEAASNRMPRKRHLGMLIAFACGFGAFVAVEVWGASLMKAFVPSPEWPDAIVSILPGGVSAFDVSRVQGRLRGVKRIHELQPLQVNLEPLEPLGEADVKGGGGPGREAYRNALLLASDYLPPFVFATGERGEAWSAVNAGDACLITEMMARARNLKLGDELKLDCGRGFRMSLEIVGILDLNWHMVTSRALVRGLNRMPNNTDGPVFVSFDTLDACDARPSFNVKMTHLWLDYEEDFLAEHGLLKASQIVEKEIAEVLGAEGNTVRTHARDEVADGTLAHGWDIIGSMARVPFVFILVISLGFVAMLVASADSRKREFVVLRSVGATKGQLVQVLIGEALKVAGWGVVIGLFGGALVGWLCTAGTRAAMANWGIPPGFAVPLVTIAKGAVGAIVFALLVAVPVSLTLVHRSIRR